METGGVAPLRFAQPPANGCDPAGVEWVSGQVARTDWA